MRIAGIAVWNNDLPMRDGPFVMSRVVQDRIRSRIVMFTLDSGEHGVGEIVFSPALEDAEVLAAIAAEDEYLPRLLGGEAGAIAATAREFANGGMPWRAVAFGLETAALDLQARRGGVRLCDLLGGARGATAADYLAISGDIEKRMAAGGTERAVLQLKLGAGTSRDDHASLETLLGLMRPDQIVMADANGGWTIAGALATISRFDDPRIYWEEPCASYQDNVEIAELSGAQVIVDQCAGRPDTAIRAIEEARVTALCIKPNLLGGLGVARDIRDACAARGMAMRIDGPFCSDVACAALLHLALGAPPELLIASCDLREPLLRHYELRGVTHCGSGRIAPPAGPGIGIADVGEQLGEPERLFLADRAGGESR